MTESPLSGARSLARRFHESRACGLRASVVGTADRRARALEVVTGDTGMRILEIDPTRFAHKRAHQIDQLWSQIRGDARQQGWILFFDEADALFGKRTRVQDSHDRYANVEVGYLAQLLAINPGLLLLGSSSRTETSPLGRAIQHWLELHRWP
ncbi:MAG: AAA family ATPase [Candidatus Eisenbacteria bacterium]